MRLIIKGGMVVESGKEAAKEADVLVEDGVIKSISHNIEAKADKVVDARGCYVMPGFIDLHVHLRDPGQTYKEDLISGANAAARGGVTTICAMPNTSPAVDSVEVLDVIYEKAKKAPVHVLQISAITKGQNGRELVDMEAMKEHGAIAFSEDGKSVMDIMLYQEAMKKAAALDMVIMAHCEDKDLVNGGVLNLGVASERFKVSGISNAVEDVITARDIFLANAAGARLHLCHCSTEASVKLVEMAKELGVHVTAEVCPHHFILTDEDIVSEDANYKMNPPLRTRRDVDALSDGICNGVMDCISTDHAPHHKEEKSKGFIKAPFGIVGLETSAALTYTELVATGRMTIGQMAERMSSAPARVLSLDNKKGSIKEGMDADIVVFNPNIEYVINVEEFASKGHNTPFAGRSVKGKVVTTIVDGKVVYQA